VQEDKDYKDLPGMESIKKITRNKGWGHHRREFNRMMRAIDPDQSGTLVREELLRRGRRARAVRTGPHLGTRVEGGGGATTGLDPGGPKTRPTGAVALCARGHHPAQPLPRHLQQSRNRGEE
jgi:hypothetical protein